MKKRCENCKVNNIIYTRYTNKLKLVFRCIRCRLSNNLKYYVYKDSDVSIR